MCKRNCIYRGGTNYKYGHGEETCNYIGAAYNAGEKYQTRTKLLLIKLGKKKPDREVFALLKGECCPFYEWNGNGKPMPAKKPEEIRKPEPEPEQPKPAHKGGGRNTLSDRQKETMELYQSGMNDKEIAEVMGVDKMAVWYWRKKQGLPTKWQRGGKKPRIDRKELMRLYQKGLSDAKVAAELGCSREAVKVWRQRSGLVSNYRKELERCRKK